MNCSPSGLPVHHQLPEPAQTHVHWVGDAIQPSHPLSSPSPPAFNLSKHQGLFHWIDCSYQVAKVLELQLQHQSFQWIHTHTHTHKYIHAFIRVVFCLETWMNFLANPIVMLTGRCLLFIWNTNLIGCPGFSLALHPQGISVWHFFHRLGWVQHSPGGGGMISGPVGRKWMFWVG